MVFFWEKKIIIHVAKCITEKSRPQVTLRWRYYLKKEINVPGLTDMYIIMAVVSFDKSENVILGICTL